MSSVVFNANAVGNSMELYPTTIGGATKMYQRYQHIMPAPEQKINAAGTGMGMGAATGTSTNLSMKTRKYTPRGMAMAMGTNCSSGSTSSASSTSSACSTTLPYNVDQSQSVQRRNARERNRVKQVNNSFARLRQHIPQSIIADLTKGGGRGPQKKISKVDTLRIAVEYIKRLQDLVEDLNGGTTTATTTAATTTAATTTGNNFNLCLDESSSQSSNSNSTHSSNLSPQQQLYYSSSIMATAAPPSALQQQQQLQRQQFPNQPLTTISLNAASAMIANANGNTVCHSPTSSFNSSMSFDSGTYEAAPQQLSPPVNSSANTLEAQLQLKFEPYEHFQLDEEDCTPDDEEILDYISLWQEQ